MKQFKVNTDEDAVIVIKDGSLKKLKKPDTGYGEQTISWRDDRIVLSKLIQTEVLDNRIKG